jgi:hypothetical protein
MNPSEVVKVYVMLYIEVELWQAGILFDFDVLIFPRPSMFI